MKVFGGIVFAVLLAASGFTFAQGLPNPYRMVDGWAQLPGGRAMGAVGKVIIDPDGRHVWAVVRCEALADPKRFGDECRDSKVDAVYKFSPDGRVVTSFGGGMFIWPHGIALDGDGNVWVTDAVYKFSPDGRVVTSFGGGMFIWPHGIALDGDGNVWVTDAVAADRIPKGDRRGHQVVKFSPEGKVLMTLGTPSMPGSGPTHFTSPADVVIGPGGEIFIGDGHNENGNNRVVKFSRDGKFIKEWGKTGYGPGEFRTLHALAMDSRGRLFVADRFNNRVQIFDQEGKFLAQWNQFGRPSGIFFDARDRIYVADSESDDVQNPGWDMGIRIGDARTGWVTEFIPFPWADPREVAGNGAEFVAVDRDGNVYGGEPRPKQLRKYVRVRP